ncbi:hypothetical protein OG930_42645 [Streptomyces sp. NBC_01799]|nr:hypothetical protein OG930_42645 [Streptomyces sp. NBC_01799]
MAARAGLIGDVGESAPAHWEAPFGTGDVHIALSALSSDAACPLGNIMRARKEAYRRSSIERHKLNQQPRTEPRSADEVLGSTQ